MPQGSSETNLLFAFLANVLSFLLRLLSEPYVELWLDDAANARCAAVAPSTKRSDGVATRRLVFSERAAEMGCTLRQLLQVVGAPHEDAQLVGKDERVEALSKDSAKEFSACLAMS